MNLPISFPLWKIIRKFHQKEMAMAIEQAHKETTRPSMIILDTIKGKGAFFAEGKLENHNMKVDYETARKACEILDQTK